MTHYIKFLFGVLVSILVQTMSAATPTPVVEYLKTGESNLYSSERIDSITFSCYDLDSVAHPVVMTQVIWYDGVPNRTLIADVNKVTLRKPETKLQPNVYEISQELFQATRSVDYDDFVIRLTADCPDDYIPKKGDKIYTLEMTYSVYPMGFMGEVLDIQVEEDGGKVLICEPMDYDEIFVSYFGSFENELYGDNIPANNAAYKLAQTPGIERDNDNQPYRTNLPSFEHSLPLDFVTPMSVAGFDLDYNRELKVKQIPTVTVSNIIYVDNGKKLRRLSFDGNLEVTVSERFQGSANYDQKIPLIEPTVPIPIAPMLCAYAEVGLLAGINVQDVEMNFSLTRNFAIKGECMFEGSKLKDLKFDRTNPNDKSNDFNVFVSGKGNVDFGGYLELGIETIAEKFWKKTGNEKFSCGKLDIFFEGGIRCTVDAKYTQEDWNNSEHNTNLYGKLSKPEGVKVGLFGTAGVEASILMFSDSLDKTFEAKPFYEKRILPAFTNTTIDDSERYFLEVQSPYKAGIIQPLLGYVAYDITESENSHIIADSYSAGVILNYDDEGHAIFEKPEDGVKYRIHPYLELSGKKILAEPYADYTKETEPSQDTKIELQMLDEYVDYAFRSDIKDIPDYHWSAKINDGVFPHWKLNVRIKGARKEITSTRSITTPGDIFINFDKDSASQIGINCETDDNFDSNWEMRIHSYSYDGDDIVFNIDLPLNWRYIKKTGEGEYTVIVPVKIRIPDFSEYQSYGKSIGNDGEFKYKEVSSIFGKTYSPSHDIQNVSLSGIDTPNPTWQYEYMITCSNSVSGCVAYALLDQYIKRYTSEIFDSYIQTSGVLEEIPFTNNIRIRDGNSTRTFYVNDSALPYVTFIISHTMYDQKEISNNGKTIRDEYWLTKYFDCVPWHGISDMDFQLLTILPTFKWLQITYEDNCIVRHTYDPKTHTTNEETMRLSLTVDSAVMDSKDVPLYQTTVNERNAHNDMTSELCSRDTLNINRFVKERIFACPPYRDMAK